MHRQNIAEGQSEAWRQVRASLMGPSSALSAEEKVAVKVMQRAGFGEKLRRATIKARKDNESDRPRVQKANAARAPALAAKRGVWAMRRRERQRLLDQRKAAAASDDGEEKEEEGKDQDDDEGEEKEEEEETDEDDDDDDDDRPDSEKFSLGLDLQDDDDGSSDDDDAEREAADAALLAYVTATPASRQREGGFRTWLQKNRPGVKLPAARAAWARALRDGL
jgi:hypothetical protein